MTFLIFDVHCAFSFSHPKLHATSGYLSHCVLWTTNWTRSSLPFRPFQSRHRCMYDSFVPYIPYYSIDSFSLGKRQEFYYCSPSFPKAGCLHRQCSSWPRHGIIYSTIPFLFYDIFCSGPHHAGSPSSSPQLQSGPICHESTQRGGKPWACPGPLEA